MVLNIKIFNGLIFIAGIFSFSLYMISNKPIFLIFFLTFFIYYFMIIIKLLYDIKAILNGSGNIKNFSQLVQKNFFSELNELIVFIKDSFYKDQLIEAVNLTFSRNTSSDQFYKIVIENLGLIFKTPNICFILYDPTIEKYNITASNGSFLKLLKSEDYPDISLLNGNIIPKFEYMHVFKTDLSELKNMGLIRLDSHLDYKGFILFGYTNSEIETNFFQKFSTIILEVQSAFNLHINDKKLKEKIYDLNLLNKIITMMEENRNIDDLLYLFLTHLTAREGLGFNRAIFFEQDPNNPNILIGKKSIGPLSYEEADLKWSSLGDCTIDFFLERGLCEDYLEPLEKLTISSKLFLNEDFTLNDIMCNNKYRIFSIEDFKQHEHSYHLFSSMNLKKFLCIPIISYQNSLGMVIVDNAFDGKAFSDARINSLINFSAQTALVINNLLLFHQVKNLSIKDGLTHLYNRRFFDEQLSIEVDRASRYNTPLSLMIIDIDYFKNYNDKNGHIEGDSLLTIISKIFKMNCRSSDFVCRYGGEEFAIILPDAKAEDAYEVAEKIRKKVYENIFRFEEKQPNKKVTISVGVSSFPEHTSNKDELKLSADKALYFSKNNGRNIVTVYSKQI